jgi:serine/threonine protein kinase
LKGLLEIVTYLHSDAISICHRDINPNNVMIIENPETGELQVKLIDFNVSKRFRDEDTHIKYLMHTNTGAAAFISPELYKKESYK